MAILDEVLLLFKANVDGTGFNKLNNQIKHTHDSIFSMKNLLRGFIGFDIYNTIKQFGSSLVQSTKDLGAMNSRFYAITKSEKLAGEELEWVFKLAERTAMGLKSTADSYSIFYAATQKSLGTGGARDVFQSWTEVSRVLHLSEYQFERVTYALREMASKGAIYSQDLRMQIGTHVPNAIGLARKAVADLGVTGNDWFEKFQKQSKGNQQLINQFIVLFSKYAKEMYASEEAQAKALELPDAQLNKLKNTWDKFLFSLADGNLFAKDLVQILKALNWTLTAITKHAHGLYNIAKTLTIIFALFMGGKAVLGMVRFGKNIALLGGLLKEVKNLKQLAMLGEVLQASNLQVFSKFFPMLAKIIPFLTKPWTIGILVFGALLFALKKFAPNAFEFIKTIISVLFDGIKNIFQWIMESPIGDFIKSFKNLIPQKSDADKVLTQKIRESGGVFNNYVYTDKQISMMTDIIRSMNRNRMPGALGFVNMLAGAPTQKQQMEYNIRITHAMEGGASIEEMHQIMKESNLGWWDKTSSMIKNTINKIGGG